MPRKINTAVHLVERVLPAVPIRQWVCTVPWALRYRLGYDRAACTAYLRCVAAALARSLRVRANRELLLRSVREAQVGMVTFVQRSDSALRLNPHLHVLVLEGVFVRDDSDAAVFHALSAPTPHDVLVVVKQVASAMMARLETTGDDDTDVLALDEPLLAHLVARSVEGRDALPASGGGRMRLITMPQSGLADPLALRAEVDGFGMYAGERIEPDDRRRLEQLCRYLARPPLSHERLKRHDNGRLIVRFRRPWKDGTAAVVLHPLELVARLAALVPPQWVHFVRYHGVLAPHATLRRSVVPHDTLKATPCGPLWLVGLAPSNDRAAVSLRPPPSRPPSRSAWAKLLARVFRLDVTVCPRCRGPMRLVAFVTEPQDIGAELTRAPRPPPSPAAPTPSPQSAFAFAL